ncbi:hypothetical protein GCM10022251_46190 [Phytohabitans flavus]|uniref:N-acetyltransferase domain-containing protein n=1 Tax=Phytohabitans flavus TaxID=1076124 RepID=A0A6F8Y7Z2_9ACTN|nr:hypothetical protein [Phytohabitans flavus]BCB82180.1 hypothetical protein Pflav_085900 [Phytohabitans flavus]
MRIETHEVLPEAMLDEAWRLYAEAFEELRTVAVQRHVLTRAEFEEHMADQRVGKYVVRHPDEVRLAALATITNDLDAVPLISPDYFRHRWPVHYAERRIWYVPFNAIHPDHRGSGIFELIVEAMHQVVASQRPGIVGLDFCRRNEERYKLPQAIHNALDRLGTVRSHRADTQAYWCYELPAAS